VLQLRVRSTYAHGPQSTLGPARVVRLRAPQGHTTSPLLSSCATLPLLLLQCAPISLLVWCYPPCLFVWCALTGPPFCLLVRCALSRSEELRKIKWNRGPTSGSPVHPEILTQAPTSTTHPLWSARWCGRGSQGRGRGWGGWWGGAKEEVCGWETFEWFVPKPGVRGGCSILTWLGSGSGASQGLQPPWKHP